MAKVSQQYSFRLPPALIKEIERYRAKLEKQGITCSRATVVRLLLKRGLKRT